MTGIVESLRSETHRIHQQLHRHPVLMPLTRNTISPEQYVRVLACFYSFYSATEKTIVTSPLLKNVFEKQSAPVISWLAQDLRFYGVSLINLPYCSYSPEIKTPAELAGFLYVREGSLLGGQHILRCLQSNLSDTDHSFQYFKGLGADTSGHWRATLRYIEQFQSNALQAVTCGKAKETFSLLSHWLDTHVEYSETMTTVNRQYIPGY